MRKRGVENLDHVGWAVLRAVAREGCAGSYLTRQNLMKRGLIEWIPGESGVRLAKLGEAASR